MSVLLLLCAFTACATSGTSSTPGPQVAHTEKGLASWYGPEFRKGCPTASGERYRDAGYTAAHRSLPFGTRVLVENLQNRRRVVVRITDRGPYSRGRILDLSGAAARALDMVRAGVVPVQLVVIP